MRLHLLTASLPPHVCGIGDYTSAMASTLAGPAQVKVWAPRGFVADPIPGVEIEPAFDLHVPRDLMQLARRIVAEAPDWLVLQYNPFSWGRWGLNPVLPAFARALTRGGVRFALMVHEPFVPVSSVQFAVMTVWQRWQLWAMGRSAAAIFFSIEPWVERFRHWFPGQPVMHLPIGSNVPRVPCDRQEARARLNIPEGTLALGAFGQLHPSRMLNRIRAAAMGLQEAGFPICVVYMGPHAGMFREALGSVPMIAEGPLTADEVSCRFAALDFYLSPFSDGVSTRRSSFMTALQHGIPVIGTRGFLTDRILRDADGRAFALADTASETGFRSEIVRLAADPERRSLLGAEGERLYRTTFAHDVTCARMLDALAVAAR